MKALLLISIGAKISIQYSRKFSFHAEFCSFCCLAVQNEILNKKISCGLHVSENFWPVTFTPGTTCERTCNLCYYVCSLQFSVSDCLMLLCFVTKAVSLEEISGTETATVTTTTETTIGTVTMTETTADTVRGGRGWGHKGN